MTLIVIKVLRMKLKKFLNMKERIDYVLVERPSSEFYSIKLLSGKYAGVIYTYGTVSLREDTKNDVARLEFEFKIDECPQLLNIDSLMKDESFMNHIGDILSCILEENEFKIGKNNTEHGSTP